MSQKARAIWAFGMVLSLMTGSAIGQTPVDPNEPPVETPPIVEWVWTDDTPKFEFDQTIDGLDLYKLVAKGRIIFDSIEGSVTTTDSVGKVYVGDPSTPTVFGAEPTRTCTITIGAKTKFRPQLTDGTTMSVL